MAVNAKPRIIHTGLLLYRQPSKATQPLRPDFAPPTGTEIAIEVRWKDENGKVEMRRPAIGSANIKTKKPLKIDWVFAGSQFVTNEETKKEDYMADAGETICVLSSPNGRWICRPSVRATSTRGPSRRSPSGFRRRARR